MKKTNLKLLAIVFSTFLSYAATGTLLRPLSPQDQVRLAEAIFRGTIVEVKSYRDPVEHHIFTRALVRVDEPLKGRFPAMVRLIHRGGSVEEASETDGFSPRFHVGEERLLFLSRRQDGTLFASRGGAGAVALQRRAKPVALHPGLTDPGFLPAHQAMLEQIRAATAADALPGSDVTDQASELTGQARIQAPSRLAAALGNAYGLVLDDNGLAARFLVPDRGEPIPYLVDADALPAGVTLPQALQAVRTALAAWSSVTSLKFTFEGVQSFGTASGDIDIPDGKLRLQLHDLYGSLAGPEVLGNGGRRSSLQPAVFNGAGWGSGGNVAGNEFQVNTGGFITIAHTAVELQNLTTLTASICHEVGHALSLAHSSENDPEPDPILKGSIMYYTIRTDGRGATLGAYDAPVIRQVYPALNTPPYLPNRVMEITTASPNPPNLPGINQIELRGYDLQGDSLTMVLANATSQTGSFSREGSTLKFTPAKFFNAIRLDPATGASYDIVYVRCSDGVNASALGTVRVISLGPDSRPAGAVDGIPDSWMVAYFGNADPAVGAKHRAQDDFDGDGFTNLQEYQMGSSPIDANSNLRITSFDRDKLQWQAKPYELYEIQASASLAPWTPSIFPALPTSLTGTVTNFNHGAARMFFRVQKVP